MQTGSDSVHNTQNPFFCGTAIDPNISAKSVESSSSEKITYYNSSDIMDEQLSSKTTRVHFKVAPSWGELTKDSIITMDEHLKLLLFVTIREINKFIDKEGESALTWERLVEIMEQNILFERKPNSVDCNVSNSKTRDETNWFKFNGDADPQIRDEVIRWIRETIQDPELLNVVGNEAMTKIGNIFASSGSAVDSFCHFFGNDDNEEFTLLDVGILRTPDITKPHIQLFRIKIYVKRQDSRILFIQNDTNTISLEANTRDYIPRETVMTNIKAAVLEKAVKEMNKLFEDIFGTE